MTKEKLLASRSKTKVQKAKPKIRHIDVTKNKLRKFAKDTIIYDSKPKLGTRLILRKRDGKLKLICKCCSACQSQSKFALGEATSLKKSNVMRHHADPTHVENAKRSSVSGGVVSGNEVPPDGAPDEEFFCGLLKEVRSGVASLSNKTKKKGQWRIQEALKWQNIKARRKCVNFTLMRDESDGRLHCRIQGITPKLHFHRATLGHLRDVGGSAKCIANGTEKIYRDACTRYLNPPFPTLNKSKRGVNNKILKQKPIFLKQDFSHLKEGTKTISIDSASNEVLAADMHKTPGLKSEGLTQAELFLPNLRWIARDSGHASRRVYVRPAQADPLLNTVIKKFALGKSSMPQRIQHSREHRKVFSKKIKQRPNHERSKVRNLRCCKHRLESIQRPTGRTCLFFVPTVQTAVQISHTHHGQQVSKDAIEWVHQLNDGGESSVACGMVADGVDEGMRFTRSIESEMADKAKVHYEVKYFLCRIDGLFGKRGCLKSGYTKMMLDNYKKTIVCHLPTKGVVVIGNANGVQPPVLDSLLRRMCIWVAGCKEQAQAEFPDYSITSALCVLDVTSANATQSKCCVGDFAGLARCDRAHCKINEGSSRRSPARN